MMSLKQKIYTNKSCVFFLIGALFTGQIVLGTQVVDDVPYLGSHLILPKNNTEFTFQDHNGSCQVCVRFAHDQVTTKALEFLQSHLSGHPSDFFGEEPGPAIQGRIVEDGLEFDTPCPRFMYVYNFKSKSLNFQDLALAALGDRCNSGVLVVNPGACTESNRQK